MKANFEEGSEARRETSRPGRDATLAHTEMVECALLDPPHVMQRGVSGAKCAVAKARCVFTRHRNMLGVHVSVTHCCQFFAFPDAQLCCDFLVEKKLQLLLVQDKTHSASQLV